MFKATPYRAPFWLPGAHLQTLWPALITPCPRINWRRERWDTPDGDFIDIDFEADGAADGQRSGKGEDTRNGPHLDTERGLPPASDRGARPRLVLFHGLEGNSDRPYARALMAATRELGWQGLVVHFRGCSGSLNRAPRAYHSGDSAEIDWVLRRLRDRHPSGPIIAAGVSLGGNALLKWLGEQGEAAARIIDVAAAICPPQDLHAGAASLSSGINRMYTEYFLRTLRPKALAMAQAHPGLIDIDRVKRSRNFFDFDDAVTAPLHGFSDCFDYWRRSSCRQFLASVRMPTLVINSRNDPFVPAACLATPEDVSPQVHLDYSTGGGHVGFAGGAPPGHLAWLPQRIVTFARKHLGSCLG